MSHTTKPDPEAERAGGPGRVRPEAATRVDPALVGARRLPAGQLAPIGPGSRIGAHEVIGLIGEGGMGQVFLARDTKLGRLVAIKCLLDADPALALRFLAEARATAHSSHENIVVIHEVDEWNGQPYMVLEYLEGQTLAALMAGPPMASERAVDLMIPVVRALICAHHHQIVHRDLKPENVFVTETGVIKVLDFGIAKAFARAGARAITADPAPGQGAASGADLRLTREGGTVGTPPYMAPEQLRGAPVDGRADIWAVGVMLHELVSGRHPLGDRPRFDQIVASAATLEEPLPSVAYAAPDLAPALVAVIDRCLRKPVGERFASATELLAALEDAVARGAAPAAEGQAPFPGLSSFESSDADRFFGRQADIRRARVRLREQPLVAVVGPSGAGKSSFLRAGLAPALTRSSERWVVLTTRPGRTPLLALARLVLGLERGAAEAPADAARELTTSELLRAEPGRFGVLLREHAARLGGHVLLVVDQFEELYALAAGAEDRLAYTACLAAAADHVDAPVRVALSMRSDFVDRLAEDAPFMAQVTRSLFFLAPLGRGALTEALTRPVELCGYHFESAALVDELLDGVEGQAGALPLLQFAATSLWARRDRERRRLTSDGLRAMGGIAGALAAHADQVLAELSPAARLEVRRLFQCLVTPDRTRAIADLGELSAGGKDAALTRQLVEQLAAARLVVVHTDADEPTVELVHESLISSWPVLARWIEEEKEGVAFLAQLAAAARQWHERGRPQGLLWRGEALDEARHLRERSPDAALGERERDFLGEALALAGRERKVRRYRVVGAFVALVLIAGGALAALWQVQEAEHESRVQAESARDQARRALEARANAEVERERAATEEERRVAAQGEAQAARGQVAAQDVTLRETNAQLEQTLAAQKREAERAVAAQKVAESEAAHARAAEAEVRAKQRELEALLAEREARVKRLEQQLSKISTELK